MLTFSICMYVYTNDHQIVYLHLVNCVGWYVNHVNKAIFKKHIKTKQKLVKGESMLLSY